MCRDTHRIYARHGCGCGRTFAGRKDFGETSLRGKRKPKSYCFDVSTVSTGRLPAVRMRPRRPIGGTTTDVRRSPGDQTLLSMNAVNWDFDTAPTLVASTLPSLNSISVGIPRIP